MKTRELKGDWNSAEHKPQPEGSAKLEGIASDEAKQNAAMEELMNRLQRRSGESREDIEKIFDGCFADEL